MSGGRIQGEAIVADGHGRFAVETIVTEAPGAGEVRVAMVAAGVCHTDHASLHWPGPLVMGHEGAGYIEQIGQGVQGLAIGQPVLLNWAIPCGSCCQCMLGHAALCERTHERDIPRLGHSRARAATRLDGEPLARAFHLGTFARYTLVRAEAVVPLPPALAVESACILGCAVMTGVGSAVNVAKVAAGASVAVVGCGGVGLNVIQGARIAGAQRIIAIDRVEARLDRACMLGATHRVHVCDDDAGHAATTAAVLALTEGRGVDHAFEATGVPALALLPLRLARHGGDAIQVSGAHGAATLTLTDLFWNKRYITPLYGDCVPSRDFPRLFHWMAHGLLETASLISHRYGMHQLDRAFDDMLAGRSIKGILDLT